MAGKEWSRGVLEYWDKEIMKYRNKINNPNSSPLPALCSLPNSTTPTLHHSCPTLHNSITPTLHHSLSL